MKNILLSANGWFISLLLLTTACQKESKKPEEIEASTTMNAAYGTDALQKMDIYLPAGRSTTTTKFLVLIHEGSWSEGDKSGFNSYIPELQERLPDYAIFNINYRLAGVNGPNTFPTQENDVKAALEFIFSKRSEYMISENFGLIGASAGGHLALLQGYKYSTPKAKAIVSFFGPTDMVDLFNSNPLAGLVLTNIVGATPTSNPTIYAQSSPITFVAASSPPTMLLHGGADPVVPVAQAEKLKAELQQEGVANEYVFFANEGHGLWTDAHMQTSFDKIADFLEAHME
jgi:dipeptidyl aminopeptidase/acylaminoacyl peptidase